MATSPNFGWLEPDNTDLVKNGALAIRTAVNAIDSSMADLKGGTTGQVLAKATNTDMDFTWTTPSSSSTLTYPINPVLNSNFSVWQRGTSVAGSGSAYLYTADRWQTEASTSITVSRQATGDTTNLPFIQYCARAQRNNASTATAGVMLSQSFESVNSIPYAGKSITFSFYARRGANFSGSSNQLGTYLTTGTGSDQNVFVGGFTGATLLISQTPTLTTTWQRFTYTATVSSSATQLGIQFTYTPTGTAGAADFYEVTGVQIDVGSTAQTYRPNGETNQAELAACQRYYQRINAAGTYSNLTNWGSAWSTTIVDMPIPIASQLRTSPTSIETSNIGVDDGVTTFTTGTFTMSSTQYSTQIPAVRYTHGSAALTQYRQYHIIANNNSSAYIGLSAEL